MFKKLARALGVANPSSEAPQAQARAAILDQYIRRAPDPQNALDLFKGDWLSSFPAPLTALQAGQSALFADSRMTRAIEAFGGVAGKTILELGPLEGGHTYSLEQAGAQAIVAVEANARAYLKCLIAKEILGLRRAQFLLGDFEDYLRAGASRFDAVVASGVLYHVRQPVELIHNLARATDHVYIWTHYYVQERIAQIAHMAHRFRGSHAAEHAGFGHTVYRYEYGDFLDTTRFAGGSEEYSHWLSRDDLFGALRHAGFTEIQVGLEELAHINGPGIELVAHRR
jgi:Protein of unknown function (DUF1698)